MTWKILFITTALTWLVGCAAFEQTPDDLHKKITSPGSGHLYERDPEKPF